MRQKQSAEPRIPPAFVVRGLEAIVQGLERLRNRLLPPPVVVINHLVLNVIVSRCLYAAAELKIADLLRDGPRDVDELAQATGAHPDALYRILRALAAVGFFAETTERRFKSTRLADCLRTDAPGSMYPSARYAGADWLFESWSGMMTIARTGKTFHESVHGTSFFEWYDRDAERRRVFDEAMTSMSAVAIPTIVAAYDFASLGSVVDVGGGEGGLLAAILRAAPNARGTLFDLPPVIARAQQAGPLSRDDVAPRAAMVAGDFFAEVPAGHDAYVLKWILHDWSDADAARILQTVRRAVRPGGRLLVVEMLVGAKNQFSVAKFTDIGMMTLTGGRERTEQEFRRLLAGSGFALRRNWPTAAGYSVLEAVPA
jgi:SAM-dependent methyltransferase